LGGSLVTGCLLTNTWNEKWSQGLGFWERLFVTLISGVIVKSWLFLLLAELDLFSMPAIVITSAAMWMLLYRLGHHPLSKCFLPLVPRERQAILPLVLLILAAVLFSYPAESFVVLDDSGIYILGGLRLAKTGKLFESDPVIDGLSPQTAQEVFFSGPASASWTRLWGQFFIWNWDRSWVSFGLLHMQRLWCGLFTLFMGQFGGLWVAPAFGLLATLGLFLLGRRLFSTAAATLSTLLLTLNFVQIRHARYPVSEMLAQALVIGGFYLLVLGRQKRHVWVNAMAGLCLGGLFLVRIDALFIGVVCAALALYWRWRGQWRSEHIAFSLALIIALAYASLHNLGWSWAYLNFLWQTAGSPALAKLALVGTLGLGTLILAGETKPLMARALSRWLSQHVWHVVAVMIAAAATLLTVVWALSVSDWNGQGVFWLAQYWTPLGLLLAGLGLARSLNRRSARHLLPLLIAALGYLTVFSLNPMVNPVQPWAMRRFVPVVLPVLALLTGHGIASLPAGRLNLHRVTAILAILALTVAFLRVDLPFLRFTEYEGSAEQIERLAQRFEPEAVILFDPGAAGQYISQSLAYVHHRNVFVLQKPRPDLATLTPFLESWLEQGAPIYLILSGGSLDWHPLEWAFVSRGSHNLRIARIQRTFNRPPDGIETTDHTLDIYQVEPCRVGPCDPPVVTHKLDMEAGEYTYLRGGFHAPEIGSDGLTYRWTDGSARLSMAYPSDRNATLRVRVAGGRPAEVEPAWLTVAVNNVPVAEEPLPAGFTFQTLEIALPFELLDGGPAIVDLRSNTWVPAVTESTTDLRELGVIVDWVEWKPVHSGT